MEELSISISLIYLVNTRADFPLFLECHYIHALVPAQVSEGTCYGNRLEIPESRSSGLRDIFYIGKYYQR